ncbi:MAG: DUF3303 domain-containing protein [Chthoniobacterales bacterium]
MEMRAKGIARFQKAGGLPPAGLKLLGRWTRADLSGGFDLWRQNARRSFSNLPTCGET